jgi:hypothetical protein
MYCLLGLRGCRCSGGGDAAMPEVGHDGSQVIVVRASGWRRRGAGRGSASTRYLSGAD